ncbi:hypothetical protein HYT01_02880 [Candidatus Giovannonibacteria bacterium]|nr:hypothetical protein [Candidatus Giovannonibacteria bacterium]
MIAPYTIFFHGILGVLSLVVFFYSEIFFRERTHKSQLSHDLGFFFLLYALYNLSVLLPLLFGADKYFWNIGLAIGFFFIFWGFAYLIKIPLGLLFPGKPGISGFVSAFYFIFGAAVSALYLYFPNSNFIAEGFVVWKGSQPAVLLNQIGQISLAWIFALAFLSGAIKVKDNPFIKWRSFLFALAAIVFSGSSYFYFAGTVQAVEWAFICAISGGVISVFAVVVLGLFKS